MAGLQSIKNRINAVQSIKKITHAMQLVSTSKLRRARIEYENVKTYNQLIEETFNSILEHLNHSELERLFPKNDKENKLYIVVTSDLGLAGSYNSNVIKLAKKTIKPNDKVVLIGVKAINNLMSYFDEKQIMTMIHCDTKESNYFITNKIMKLVYKAYKNNEVSSINIIYNKFVNNLVQEETVEKIFPFEIKKEEHKLNLTSTIEFEPSAHVVLDESIPMYLNSRIYYIFASAKLSEMASRRSAMETATDNANNLIDELQLKYNRKRQSNITQELNEIVAGADAV